MAKSTFRSRVRGGFVQFWDEGARRREFVYTVFWDTLVIASAMIGRGALLWLHTKLPEALAADRGIQLLDWVAERAMVALAITFAVFDLLKRVWQEFHDLVDVVRRQHRSGGGHEG